MIKKINGEFILISNTTFTVLNKFSISINKNNVELIYLHGNIILSNAKMYYINSEAAFVFKTDAENFVIKKTKDPFQFEVYINKYTSIVLSNEIYEQFLYFMFLKYKSNLIEV